MGQERANDPLTGVRSYILGEAGGVEQLIARLASPQVGRVSRRQLLAGGLTPKMIESRISRGLLIVERPGVYAVGYSVAGEHERWATALLDAGSDSMISHLSAGGGHRFLHPAPVVVDVTSPRRLRVRPGIRMHCRKIDPRETWRLHGIPITSPAQTLFDLGTMLRTHAHVKAANEAFVLKPLALTLDDLHLVAERNQRRKGARAFARMLAILDPEGREIRSPLEARLNSFPRARGYPPWEQNVRLRVGADTIKPDVIWREQRVIVEADGRDPHLAPLTFVSDRRRDRRLQVEGWHPVRATSQDLGPGVDEFDSDLRALLGI